MLLAWSKRHRRHYPWRRPGVSAYQVLLAELVLKRTTAAAAARAYGPFLKKYPTIDRLAIASEEDLARSFEPIGLSRQRASSVRRLAQALVTLPNGVPTNLSGLLALPSIGEYSARAILSFGHRVPVGLVDGNVARIFRRVFQNHLTSGNNQIGLQDMADLLVPPLKHREFNFALIDLGSSVCRPTKPLCHECPFKNHCDYAMSLQKLKPVQPLRAVRQSLGLSLVNLAKMAGVSKLTIVNIEAGRTKARPDTLVKLAQAMDVCPTHIENP